MKVKDWVRERPVWGPGFCNLICNAKSDSPGLPGSLLKVPTLENWDSRTLDQSPRPALHTLLQTAWAGTAGAK